LRKCDAIVPVIRECRSTGTVILHLLDGILILFGARLPKVTCSVEIEVPFLVMGAILLAAVTAAPIQTTSAAQK